MSHLATCPYCCKEQVKVINAVHSYLRTCSKKCYVAWFKKYGLSCRTLDHLRKALEYLKKM